MKRFAFGAAALMIAVAAANVSVGSTKSAFATSYFPLNAAGAPQPITLVNPALPPSTISPYGCDLEEVVPCAAGYPSYTTTVIDATHTQYTPTGTEVANTRSFKE